MTPEERDIVSTTVSLGAAFFLAILAVCWVVSMIAATLQEWSATR